MTLGEKVKTLRKNRGLSQQELSDMTEVAQSYICGIESGRKSGLTLTTLKRLAKALDVTVDYLVSDDDSLPIRQIITQNGNNNNATQNLDTKKTSGFPDVICALASVDKELKSNYFNESEKIAIMSLLKLCSSRLEEPNRITGDTV